MKRFQKYSQLKILTVMILLLSIFMAIIGITNSWFTSGENKKIEIEVHIGQIDIELYQVKTDGTEVLINTNEDNQTVTTPSYIDITDGTDSREIVPDQNYTLNLVLRNSDEGNQSLYVRYKIELYACGNNYDILLHPNISGYTTPTGNSNGFVYDPTDGYFYYRNNEGENQTLTSQDDATLIGSFMIPYSDFAFAGNYSTINGNNLKLVLTVEGYDVDPQA